MPLFHSRKSKGLDYKARLEHKLYLARENPEPVFDISQCNLKSVPPGVFSLCKVFRKEALYLQENILTTLSGGGSMLDLSLLQILNLHSNNLTSLPDDIEHLKNLKLLNISSNQLKHLPEAIARLCRLEYLDVSCNQLVDLTSAVGSLRCLLELNITENKLLNRLPTALCHATNLREIQCDSGVMRFPPHEIASRGTGAIMRFLSKEAGVEYEPNSPKLVDPTPDSLTNSSTGSYADDGFQEIKQQDMLAMTRVMDEHQRNELAVHAAMKKTKVQLLDDLLTQESKLEGKILRVQHDHETERNRLINNLLQVEQSANQVVSHLLALRHNLVQDNQEAIYLAEQERLAEEELLNSVHQQYESLRRKDILKAMETMLAEEYQCEQKLREYEEGRAITTRTLLSQEIDNDEQLGMLIISQDKAQTELISRIQRDEELQRAAVGALLERGDARSWGLIQQVSLVESQLAAMTAMEMKRKKLQLDEHVSDLCDQRVALSQLLVELLDQQAGRRKELIKTMEEMEKRRWSDDDESGHDFWLRQYQRLLDSRPGTIAEMERTLNPLLAQNLLMAGVIHCLPFLAVSLQSTDSLALLTDEKLGELGICLAEDRKAILEAVQRYLEEESQETPRAVPSAPRIENNSTTHSLQEPEGGLERAECVACMEQQCEVVFVPCGHMCCCIKCAETLLTCPMCRADLQQKIRVILP